MGFGILTDVDLSDLLLTQNLPHLIRQLDTHVLPTAVHGDSIYQRVRPRQVNVFENIRGVGPSRHDLSELGGARASLRNEYSLSRHDVLDVAESKLCQGD